MSRLLTTGKIGTILFLMAGCSTPSESPTAEGTSADGTAIKASGVPDRDIKAAASAIAAGATLVDVRTQAEFEEGHLEGSILIPVQELETRLAELEKANGGKEKQIILVCRSGGRAGRAKTLLQDKGYSTVSNAGGWASLCGEKVAGAGANGCKVMTSAK
ncbi:MAG: rhodanese-like domain-containing protein [Deltaproteobacteria bacterium]|nr:rhodanese-like domain-containing protein [Deltaproteobacteria bacterium]